MTESLGETFERFLILAWVLVSRHIVLLRLQSLGRTVHLLLLFLERTADPDCSTLSKRCVVLNVRYSQPKVPKKNPVTLLQGLAPELFEGLAREKKLHDVELKTLLPFVRCEDLSPETPYTPTPPCVAKNRATGQVHDRIRVRIQTV
jgi:hypothetical protein